MYEVTMVTIESKSSDYTVCKRLNWHENEFCVDKENPGECACADFYQEEDAVRGITTFFEESTKKANNE